MRLINADGSAAELSGNGLRALAAIVIRHRGNASQVVAGAAVVITTDAGPRPLTLVDRTRPAFHLPRGHGPAVEPAHVDAGRRRRGRPRCRPSRSATRSASCSARCPMTSGLPGWARRSSATPSSRTAPTSSSPSVEAPDRVRIRIWERGVGPTESSGTGACAAAVAAIAHGRRRGRSTSWRPAARQRVEWRRRRAVPDRLGGTALGRDLACRPLTRPSRPSRATRRRRSGSTAAAAPSASGSRRPCSCCCSHCRCRCPSPATGMAAILALVVVLWMTEALPMAVTAMLGPMLAVIFGVADARGALAPFADPIIFLFIGSFILAEAMFVHGVDRRIAFTALSSRFVGASATRILVVYAAVATVLSMWISNTATTAMMFPIGLSIVDHLMRVAPRGRARGSRCGSSRSALMLITSFGASVGGMATPVGTPPNLIGIGMLERIAHVRITFFHWMALGVPIVVLLFVFLAVLFCCHLHARPARRRGQRRAACATSCARLGRLSRSRAQRARRVRRDRRALDRCPGLLTIAGWRTAGVRAGVREGDARGRRGDDRRDAAVRAARRLACAAVHAHVGSGGPDRLGNRPALRRRAGDGRAGVFDRAGRRAGARDHRVAAVARYAAADGALHRRRHPAVGGDVQHGLGEHDRAGRDRGCPGRRRATGASPRSAPRSARAWGS